MGKIVCPTDSYVKRVKDPLCVDFVPGYAKTVVSLYILYHVLLIENAVQPTKEPDSWRGKCNLFQSSGHVLDTFGTPVGSVTILLADWLII